MTGMIPKSGAGAIRNDMARQSRQRVARQRGTTPWPSPRPAPSGWSIGPDGHLRRTPAPNTAPAVPTALERKTER